MTPRFINNPSWAAVTPKACEKGDYVIATKYVDGDPGDHFCVGFYDGFYDHFGERRHLVVDAQGKQFRRNGFRRAQRIASNRGNWVVRNIALIDMLRDRHSVWHYVRAPWAELNALEQTSKRFGAVAVQTEGNVR